MCRDDGKVESCIQVVCAEAGVSILDRGKFGKERMGHLGRAL